MDQWIKAFVIMFLTFTYHNTVINRHFCPFVCEGFKSVYLHSFTFLTSLLNSRVCMLSVMKVFLHVVFASWNSFNLFLENSPLTPSCFDMKRCRAKRSFTL